MGAMRNTGEPHSTLPVRQYSTEADKPVAPPMEITMRIIRCTSFIFPVPLSWNWVKRLVVLGSTNTLDNSGKHEGQS